MWRPNKNRIIFLKFKAGEKFSAEKLHCVQPQEYIKYVED